MVCRAQTAVFEIAMILLLFSVVIVYFFTLTPEPNNTVRAYSIESYAKQLALNSTVRSLVLSEEISNPAVLMAWSSVLPAIETIFPSYELYIKEGSTIKVIHTCSEQYSKVQVEELIMIHNTTLFSVRVLGFGVCG